MPGRPTPYEAQARAAAERIERARAQGEQLTFLPDEAGAPPVDTLEREAGDRRGRGPGKAVSQLREFLAARGWQMPEDVIGRIAGLDAPGDVLVQTMHAAERLVLWAFDGRTRRVKQGDVWVEVPAEPSPEQMLAAFSQLYTARLRAAEALLPYGTPKATPDAGDLPAVPVYLVPAAPSPAIEGTAAPRIPAAADRRMMPADMRHQIERNQEVSGSDPKGSDAEIRTERPSR